MVTEQDRWESGFERVFGFRPGRADAVAAGLLLLGLAVFFAPVLLGKVFFFRDIATEIVPKRTWLTRAGLQVLWNPYMFFGLPEGANPQSSTFYPLNLIFYLGPVPRMLTFYIVTHFAIAAAFAYLLLRALRSGAEAALIGAVAFTFGGAMVSCANQVVVLNSVTWIMPLLWALLRGLATGRKSFIVVGGAFWALMVLGGEPEIAYLAGMVAAIFLAGVVVGGVDLGDAESRLTSLARWRRAGVVLGGALVGAVGLSCVQWLYTLELAGLSNRAGGLSWTDALKWSLEPRMLWSLLAPNYFMDQAGAKYWVLGLRNESLPYLLTVYPGLAAGAVLAAGVAAIVVARGSARVGAPASRSAAPASAAPRSAAVFGAGAVVFVLLSLGRWGGLYWVFYHVLPGFDRFRIPERCMIGFAVFFALVLGQGVEALAAGRERAAAWLAKAAPARLRLYWIVLAAAGVIAAAALLRHGLGPVPQGPGGDDDPHYYAYQALLLGLALTRALGHVMLLFALAGAALWRPRLLRYAFFAAAVLVWSDLFTANRQAAPTTTADFFDLKGNLAEQLPRNEAVPRVMAIQPDSPEYFMIGVKKELAASFKKDRLDIQAFTGLELGLREVGARSSFYPADADIWVGLLRRLQTKPLQFKLLAQGGVSFALWPGSSPIPIPDALPRAYVVPAADWRANRDEALARIADPGFDPRRAAVLEGRARAPVESRGNIFWPMTVTADENQHVEVEVDKDHPGYLVLLDTFYPGWTATVNGQPAEIIRANGFFRAVAVGAEGGIVAFDYRPVWFYAGLAVSLLAVILCGVVVVRERAQAVAREVARVGAPAPRSPAPRSAAVIIGWLGLVVVLVLLPMVDGATDYRAATLQRIAVLVMAAAWTWGLEGDEARLYRTGLDAWVAALWVLVSVALVRTPYFYISFYWTLYVLTLILLFYFMVQFTAGPEGGARARGVMAVLVAGGALESVWAVAQTAAAFKEGHGRLAPWFQAAGGYLNPSLLAGSLIAITPYVLARLLDALQPRETARVGAPTPPMAAARSAGWAALLALLFAGMVATGSRALIFLVPLLLVGLPGLGAVFQARGIAGRKAWVWSGAVFSGLAVVGVVLLLVLPGPVRTRVQNLKNDPYAWERVRIWRTGLAVAADHPLGAGLGMFKYYSNQHRFPVDRVIAGRYEKHAETAHNEYLQLAAELSPLGPVLLLIPLGWLGYRTARARPGLTAWAMLAGLLATALHGLTEANLNCMAIGALAVTLAGVLVTELARADGAGVMEMATSRRGVWALRAVLTLAAAAGAAGSCYFAYGQGLTLAGSAEPEPARAALLLTNSARYAAGNVNHYKALAGAQYALFRRTEDAKALSGALRAVGEAIKLNPADPDLYRMRGEYSLSLYLLSRDDRLLNGSEGAERSFAEALARSPYDVDAAIGLAWSAKWRGDREAERDRLRAVLAIEPDDLSSRLRLARSLAEDGRMDQAAAEWAELTRRRAEVKAARDRNPAAFDSGYRARRAFLDEGELREAAQVIKGALEKPGADD